MKHIQIIFLWSDSTSVILYLTVQTVTKGGGVMTNINDITKAEVATS